ncbi:hypothetical protein D9757_009767 [Collybiopsis confluens]|uniref:DUF6534 domain-containing protein n=1 Tax=Collybiopsis confluens TaxID=2823264 RepID=A0A8H5GYN6_9AGAR|nr:hypothetical protein D9757_009767 [Collybiopsis confluens]
MHKGPLVVQTFSEYPTFQQQQPHGRSHQITRLVQVFYLMVVEVCNSVFDIALIYEPLITRYGSPVPMAPTFLPADALTTAMISTPVQLFMAWRIKKITNSIALCAVIVFSALCALVGGTWLSISSVTANPFTQSPKNGVIEAPVILWLASSGVTDLLITFIVVVSLLRKQRGKHTDLDPYVNRVIRLSIQAGVLTSLAVLADMVVFLSIQGGAPYFFIWDLILSKLYTNSLLTSLNSRPTSTKFGAPKIQNALFRNESESHELTTFTTVTTAPTFDGADNSLRTIMTPKEIQKPRDPSPYSTMQTRPQKFYPSAPDTVSQPQKLGYAVASPNQSLVSEGNNNVRSTRHIGHAPRVHSLSATPLQATPHDGSNPPRVQDPSIHYGSLADPEYRQRREPAYF